MISNFALLLSQEGIKLAHRTPDGWAELGHVNLLSDDLPQKLESLRKQGEALAVTDFTTKIVLPNDQVKYLTLPSVDDDQREEAIKAALERATPYLIEDLVYDWEDGDDGMNIAAVAGATLTEAESFITQYGFNPTSFVAAPDDALFSVEPFFGTCSSYTADDDVSENIEAEVDKVILSASEEAPMAEAVDDTPEEIEAEAEAEKAAQIEITDAITDLAEAEQSDEDEAKPFIAPLVADRDEDVSMAVFPTIGPATSTSILGGMEPRVRPAPRIGIGAEEDRDILDRSFPTWAGEAERDRPFSMDENIEAKKIGWLKAEDAEKDDDTTQPPSWMKTDDAIVEAEPEFEEESEAAAWVAPTVAAPINQPLFDEVDTEAEKLEIFGNRGDRSDKGAGWNPLLIGGIVLALILLIGVSYAGVRYFSSSTQPQIAAPETTIDPVTDPVIAPVAEATPDAQDEVIAQEDTAEPETIIETPAIEVTSDLPEVTATPEAANEELAIEPTSAIAEHDAVTLPDETPTEPLADTAAVVENTTAPAPEEPVQEVNETIAPQTQILTEAPTAAVMAPERPASETPDAPLEADPEAEVITEAIAPAETAPVETVREEPVIADLLERAESDWTTLSVPAREARYAATGIWPIAPVSPPAPAGENVGSLFLATIDPVVFATDAYAITSEAEMLADKALTTVPNPPAPGTKFDRDDRGLIVATPEGAITPNGVIIFAGIPPQVPPLAPRPDPVVQQEEVRSELAGKIPQLRPETAVPTEDNAATTTGEAEAAEDFEQIASRPPPLRPAEIAALAIEPEVIVNPLAITSAPTPRLRPSNFGEILYATERAIVAAQTTTAVAPSSFAAGEQATEEGAISLRGINLIGIYGEAGDRRALVRLQSGRYTKIEVGDRLNGGQVSAIDKDRLLYIRNGQTVVLRMPSN